MPIENKMGEFPYSSLWVEMGTGDVAMEIKKIHNVESPLHLTEVIKVSRANKTHIPLVVLSFGTPDTVTKMIDLLQELRTNMRIAAGDPLRL